MLNVFKLIDNLSSIYSINSPNKNMATESQFSPTEVILDRILKASNPFDRPPVVKVQNVWGESFPDVSSLNAHASNAIIKALSKVRTASSTLDKSTSLVLLAERGVGKTHLIQRIRKHLYAEGDTFFIYASADKYGDLDFINSCFQQSVAESLEQLTKQGISQWQEVAALIVTDGLKANNQKAIIPSAIELVKRFDIACKNSHKKGRDLVADLTKAIQKLKPDADPYITRAIIWTLSEERGSLAVKWLAGEQLDAKDALEMRLPTNEKSEKEKESSALTRITRIIFLLEEYKSILICFDELDSISTDSNGFPTAYVITDLIKRIFDTIKHSNNSKGISIICLPLPDTWRSIQETRHASTEKLCSFGNGEPIDLQYVNAAIMTELVTLWLEDFYKKLNLCPPTPIFPFSRDEIDQQAKLKLSVREALRWCSITFSKKIETILGERMGGETPPPSPSLPPLKRFERAYEKALEQFSEESKDYLDDNDLIAEAIRFSFERIIAIEKIKNIPIEGVVVSSIEEVTPKSKNNGYLQFKIVITEGTQSITIGIGVLQQTRGLTVGAGFKRLLEFKTFGLNRSCLVRSRERKLKRNWDSCQYYQQLVEQGGEWVDLKEEEIKPLLGIKYVYDNREAFDLTEKRLDSFACVQKILIDNPLLKEILSKPIGQVHEEALEGQEVQHLYSDQEVDQMKINLDSLLEESTAQELDEELDLSDLGVA